MRILYVTPTERRAILAHLKPECRRVRTAEDGHLDVIITSDGTAGGVFVLALRVQADIFPDADVLES